MTKNRSEITPGEELEFRVARLYFWTGWFARSSVNLSEQFHPDQLLLTDLDLLAYRFDPLLRRQMLIGESKSGEGKSAPKALDRMFWLAGVARYTQADGAVLTTRRKISSRVRQVADSLDVTVFTTDDLSRHEQVAGVSVERSGSFDPELIGHRRELRRRAEHLNDADRYLRFLWSELWLLDPWVALKRLVSLLNAAAKRWHEHLEADEEIVLRYVLSEAVVAFAYLALVTTASVLWLPAEESTAVIIERLSEGLASTRQLVRLSEGVDRLLAGLLRELDAPPSAITKAQGAFYPRPPGWAEAYIELVGRLSANPAEAADLPRLMDVAIFDTFGKGGHVDPQALQRLGTTDLKATLGLARQVGAFLSGQVAVPPEVFSGLDPATLGPRSAERAASPDRVAAQPEKAGPAAASPDRGAQRSRNTDVPRLPLGDEQAPGGGSRDT